MEAAAKFAQVIIPLPVAGDFTYIVPPDMQPRMAIGLRVVVPFGKRHYYTGIVAGLSPVAPPGGMQLKEISILLDEKPIVRPQQIRLWRWMADYYLCTVGEVFKAALPSGLKLESETRVELSAELDPEVLATCDSDRMAIVEYVRQHGSVTVDELEKKVDAKNIEALASSLIDKHILAVSEKLVERYHAVKRTYVRPTMERGKQQAIEEAFKAVARSRKQEEALVALVALSEFYKTGSPLIEVPVEVLMDKADVTRANIKALADKGLCELYDKEISRFSSPTSAVGELPKLSEGQNKALNEIHTAFNGKDVVLLHGVTSSGKTEIYIHLIDFVLRQGKQALFLVPEIALTTQLTRRLQKVFGSRVLIYHSKFSDNERVDLWRRMLDASEPIVAIGARSAVFLPFKRLGLVIVDEEHEPSYKQFDPAPRYNGRDAAVMLAIMHGAKTLFGSATPSVETYYKATTGKFGLVELLERFDGASLPSIEIIDMKEQRRNHAVEGYLSRRLVECTLDVTGRGKQAILFHNRRGYAPMARCKMCAFVPHCDFCDVSLTYHRRKNVLQCHYCGAEYPVPELCPECKEPAMEILGYGTERLEDEIGPAMSGRKLLRMDLDTTRNKEAYGKIIDDFSMHKADILVGTQMVTKGLDFGAVELVGVLNADQLINIPDFRSSERAFNMIEQVAGRAGRRGNDGRVFIQTYNPDHPLLRFVKAHDYRGFYEHELAERRAFNFPPFCRIVNIYLKHREARTVAECAATYARSLRTVFGSRITDPQEPPVSRVQMMYIRKIMLKIEPAASLTKVKEILRDQWIKLSASPIMRGLAIYYDVDPC